jgi:hypothetical protein
MNEQNEMLDQFQNHPLFQMVAEMGKTDNPRFHIILASGILEMMTNAIIKERCKNHKKLRNQNYATKILILNELGFIQDAFYELLELFRDLRNNAAHGGRHVITNKEIIQFERIFPKNVPHGEKLFYICNHLTFSYYNANIQYLQPTFLRMARENRPPSP